MKPSVKIFQNWFIWKWFFRSSTSTAAAAFAIATSASSNPRDHVAISTQKGSEGPGSAGAVRARCSMGDTSLRSGSCRDRNRRKESVMSTAATMRVLNVLRHWVSKHAQVWKHLLTVVLTKSHTITAHITSTLVRWDRTIINNLFSV